MAQLLHSGAITDLHFSPLCGGADVFIIYTILLGVVALPGGQGPVCRPPPTSAVALAPALVQPRAAASVSVLMGRLGVGCNSSSKCHPHHTACRVHHRRPHAQDGPLAAGDHSHRHRCGGAGGSARFSSHCQVGTWMSVHALGSSGNNLGQCEGRRVSGL